MPMASEKIDGDIVSPAERQFLLAKRQALIIELGAIEDRLGMARSIIPRHSRPKPPGIPAASKPKTSG